MNDTGKMRIFFLDAGRKYFFPSAIRKILDSMKSARFTHLILYVSDNQGFRLRLRDMTLTTGYGTYDLAPALGDGYRDGIMTPDGSNSYLTANDIESICSYASESGIALIPSVNMPGHLGAILEHFPHIRFGGSRSSIDLQNPEAVAFAHALLEKYAAYFASLGCRYFHFGADEYANDTGAMGFSRIYGDGTMRDFVQFVNKCAGIIKSHGMTPMCFNDGIYYADDADTYGKIDGDIIITYWSRGWSGYDLAAPSTLANAGFRLVNANADYYWVLGRPDWQLDAKKAAEFDASVFNGGGTAPSVGSMLCVWCDRADTDGTDGGDAVASAIAPVIAAFGG